MRSRLARSLGITAILVTSFVSVPAAQRQAATRAAEPPAATAVDARPDRADLDAVYRIKDEGLQRSQVMDTAWNLTDVHGPRLTNSPGMHAAADWAIKRMTEWGLSSVRKEAWGPFGRGWANGLVELRNRFTGETREIAVDDAAADISAALTN